MYCTSKGSGVLEGGTGVLSKIYLITMHDEEPAYEIGKKLIKKLKQNDAISRFFITSIFNYYKY